MAATPAQVREVIGKYMEAWATGNKELLLSIFAEDATWEDPVGSPAFVGHEGVAKFWDFARQGADEGRTISPRIDQVIACGNEGILRFTMQVRVPAQNQGLDLAVVDYGYQPDDVLYTCLPLFHGNALNAASVCAFVADASLVLARRFSARAFWDESCAGVPAGMDFFAPNIEQAYTQ